MFEIVHTEDISNHGEIVVVPDHGTNPINRPLKHNNSQLIILLILLIPIIINHGHITHLHILLTIIIFHHIFKTLPHSIPQHNRKLALVRVKHL